MTGKIKTLSYDSLARTISVLFHPLLMPVYGMLIIFSSSTPFGVLPPNVKRLLLLIVAVNNIFIPISLLPFLMHMNFISEWNLGNKEERKVPMIISTILYATTSYIIFRFPIPHFLKSFFFSTFLLSLIVTIVNFRWKISLHSVGLGALLALILYVAFRMYSPLAWYIVLAVIVSGLVLSSRLQLNAHSPRQVWFGFITGFTGLTIFLYIFQHLIYS